MSVNARAAALQGWPTVARSVIAYAEWRMRCYSESKPDHATPGLAVAGYVSSAGCFSPRDTDR